MEEMEKKLDQLSIGAIRALVIDEISKANSGHPGMPLDIAPAIYTLVKNHLVADPKDPSWINRDRFVLSSGHCSALLYAVLHLAGYAVSLEDLKNFRQLDSLTPGHPEFGHTAGVDATAGPLGQGIAQAVGMAIAEKAVSAEYPEGAEIMSHYTYCLCGDGCLEEGISQEAISLAGHLKLNKLILIYDENTSTLDGPTSNSLTEDEKLRFKASEWNVLEVADGNDVEAIDKAIAEAKKSASAPTMIVVHTRIGYGSPKEGSCKCHGNPLTAEEGAKAKETYAYDYPAFTVPEEVYANFAKNFAERGAKAHAAHEAAMKAYAAKHPEDYARFEKAMKGDLKEFLPEIPEFAAGSKDASRNTSGKVVAAFQAKCPFAFGGSADVAGSVKTAVPGDPGFSAEHPEAKNVNWGIREFGMGCAQNGILLHGGLRTYVGCFLVFADYMKPAIRMAAMENLPAIYLFSHDSIAVGEDGPTHEPIEQLCMLRSIPNVHVYRPADERETYAAWQMALLSEKTPTCLILSRQNLPLLEKSSVRGVSQGAYIVYEGEKKADYQIIATGSEVSLAIEAAKILAAKGINLEVVSMPSMEVFEEQDEAYKARVLHLPHEKRISLEMLSTFGWGKYAKYNIGLDRYGKSSPANEVMKALGFTAEEVAKKIASLL